MGKVYNIDSDYFKELLNHTSRNLVGKIMKRFEICNDVSILKSTIKETIYEHFREFDTAIDAHQHGWEKSIFVFKSNQKKEE